MEVTERAATSGFIAYRRADEQAPGDDVRKLEAAARPEPLLKKWRDHCSPGLIDENGKVRNVFRKTIKHSDDPVSQVIKEVNRIPAAVADFERALAANQALDQLTRDHVNMPVYNARELQQPSLDSNGFVLARHRSEVGDWSDEREVAAVYYAEIAHLVQALTGASHAFSNNHLRRQSEPEAGGDGPLAKLMAQSRGPVLGAHNDFTEAYGEGILKTIAADGVPHTQTFGLTEAMLAAGVDEALLLASRILVVNTWRSVTPGPLQRFPLALTDRRSVPADSLHRATIGKVPSGQPRGGIEIFSASHSEQHRWYYYPDLTPDEVILWKGYDSAEVPAQPTLHTSFDDPQTPPHARQRRSIESRVLCLLPG